MKTTLRISVAMLLLVSILLLSSCGFYWRYPDLSHRGFPEGYTGGWGADYYGQDYEYFWVETYDELTLAVEKLKSHGSTFAKSVILDYEGDLVDVKYCFSFGGRNRDYIRYGEDPFDRYASDVAIFSVAFTEDISIDELMLSHVDSYENYRLYVNSSFDIEALDHESIRGELVDRTYYGSENPTAEYKYNLYDSKNELILVVEYYARSGQTTQPSQECIDAVIDSVRVLEPSK